jgi:hypothetical protein
MGSVDRASTGANGMADKSSVDTGGETVLRIG